MLNIISRSIGYTVDIKSLHNPVAENKLKP